MGWGRRLAWAAVAGFGLPVALVLGPALLSPKLLDPRPPGASPRPPGPPSGAAVAPGRIAAPPRISLARRPDIRPTLPVLPSIPGDPCSGAARFAQAAQANARGVEAALMTPFRRTEAGWGVYAPLAGREVGAPACPPGSTGFAARLADWQGGHGLARTGVMDVATLDEMAEAWLMRRPFVQAMRRGCPDSPPEAALATARPDEAWGGKRIEARPGALEAWRRMVAAARAELPDAAADRSLLTPFSAWRGPDEEATRCATGACDGLTRAHCSAHRTGLAFDLYLGGAAGERPDSTDDANRLRLSRTTAYRWLAANAARFGFVPYPYEPWHWEWTGEAP